MIWEQALAALESRRINIDILYTNTSHLEHPGVLQACHNSRSIFLKSYQAWGKYFRSTVGRNPRLRQFSTAHESYAYINFAKDTFVTNVRNCGYDLERKGLVLYEEGEPKLRFWTQDPEGLKRIPVLKTYAYDDSLGEEVDDYPEYLRGADLDYEEYRSQESTWWSLAQAY